jgi:SPP1 family predicted phage head-tail adaptor
MAICKNIRATKRDICIGDLDSRIKIQVRTLKAPESGVDFTEEFTEVKEVWAMVQTSRGLEFFDDTGLNTTFTHKFYIRFSSSFSITSEDWLEWNNQRYDIVEVENLDERNEFLLLKAIKKGDKDINANKV